MTIQPKHPNSSEYTMKMCRSLASVDERFEFSDSLVDQFENEGHILPIVRVIGFVLGIYSDDNHHLDKFGYNQLQFFDDR